METWEVVLSGLECIEETGGGGDDELAVMFRSVGQHVNDANELVSVGEEVFSGSIVENAISGMELTGAQLGGEEIAVEGVFPLSAFSAGRSIRGMRLSPARGFNNPIVIEAVGLEIDGLGSTLSQGNTYLSEFRSGTIDLGNDDVLWHATWRVFFIDLDTPVINFVEPNQTLLETDDILEAFTPGTDSGWVAGTVRHYDQVICLHNRDQSSEYHLKISFRELPDNWVT